MTHRILSFDGGIADLYYLRAMREIEIARPGFLNRADGFAGVSDGANCALFFATAPPERRGVELIDQAIEMTEAVLRSMQPRLINWLRLLSLTRALNNAKEPASIVATYIGATTRLNDLPGKVTVLSYRVRSPTGISVYQNYEADKINNPLAIDVALKSGSFPAVFPVTEGHADGGLFANNPAAVAVALAASPYSPLAPGLPHRQLSDIRLLSLGFSGETLGGRCVQDAWQKPSADWGLGQWFLYPTDPLLFFQALFNSVDGSSSFQCRALLGPHFLRVSVPSRLGAIGGITRVMLGQVDGLIQKADDVVRDWRESPTDAAIKPSFEDTLAWLDACWMREPSELLEVVQLREALAASLAAKSHKPAPESVR